uniref:Mitochondrial resolvase Ydc2 catalytic domain-containing protein n=1 Tax=viral metagenome TaxID=1070528 RepID=A0A6C0LTD4_9ZZZZ
MLCASFDIGKKNFSFYVEEFDKNKTTSLATYNANGTPTFEFETTLVEIYTNGSTVLLENIDITDGCDPKMTLDPETFHNMTDVLDRYSEIWDRCSVFIIEKQMMFGKQTNPMAVKLGQHCYSYFAIRYGRFKNIIEFPAYNKTQILGSEKIAGKLTKTGKITYKAIDKPKRKKWCISKALEVLELRDDSKSIVQIQNSKKKDDLCDVICQLQSWKYLYLYNK